MVGQDHASKTKGLVWLVAAGGVACVFAMGIAPLLRIVPWAWEEKLGQLIDFSPAEKTCQENPKTAALLQKITGRLYPVQADDAKFSINVQIVKDPAINAFAGLGGKVVINSGLLRQAQSPEEVAGVLAHEIEHVRHRHILQGVVIQLMTTEGLKAAFGGSATMNWANYFLKMHFSQTQEVEADSEGLKRLQKAQIDNRGFKEFFERMADMETNFMFLSDHPASQFRSALVNEFPNIVVTPIMPQADWLMLKHSCDE